MKLTRLIGAATIALAAACGREITPPPTTSDLVTITPSKSTIAAGESMTFTLRNDDSVNFGYNICGDPLEIRNGDRWTEMPTFRLCPAILYTLPAGPPRSARVAKTRPPARSCPSSCAPP